MSSSLDSPSPAVRIPAWKRLGLKLKSAQDTPPETASADIPSPKRKRLGKVDEASSVKKPKLSPDSLKVTPLPARKKSVTFTPETKSKDGDSIKALFSAWVAEQKNQEELSAPVFQISKWPTVEEAFDTTLDEKERRVQRVNPVKQGDPEVTDSPKAKDSKKAKRKKETSHLPNSGPTEAESGQEKVKSPAPTKTKKAKKAKPVKDSPTPALPEKPFLAYLKQYSDSKDTWKFNKNHQSHLLKHLFNIDVVPSSYTKYLYEYIKGLQGNGVRTRVRDSAIAVKVKDLEDPFPTDMENSEQRKRDYDTAMSEYVATMMAADVGPDVGYEEGVLLGLSDAAMPTRIAKRKRAEWILAEIGSGAGEVTEKETVVVEDESQKRLRMNDGSAQKVARKRKQRTMVEEDDTSSEEDFSDSEDSSSDESTTQRVNAEGSSSSSSSSSSGSEDSESDDESEEESESDNE